MRELGLKAYLIKPVKSSELLQRDRACDGHQGRRSNRSRPQCRSRRRPVAREPLRILLAEDSPDNRLLIKQYLKKLPYDLGWRRTAKSR